MDTYEVERMGRQGRRRHSAQFKQAVIGECLRPGVSMAAVALRHGLNANMVRKWVIGTERGRPVGADAKPVDSALPALPTFVPLALPAAPVEGEIRIEVQRAGTTVNVRWPAAAGRECAAWLRDWLR